MNMSGIPVELLLKILAIWVKIRKELLYAISKWPRRNAGLRRGKSALGPLIDQASWLKPRSAQRS
jgi:hypothetical protein